MPYTRTYGRRTYRRRPYYRSRSSLIKPRAYGISLAQYKPATGNADRYHTILHRNFTVSSSSGAAIEVQLPFSGVSAATNWSSLTGVFSEFRVEAIRVKFTPALPNSQTATFAPVYMFFDSDGLPSLSNANALQYPSVVSFDINKPFTKMYSITNNVLSRSSWYSTTTPGQQTEAVGLVGENFSISTTYGNIQISYFVCFRGGQ